MRLDKYLKITRLIKRRTLAKEICDGGRVMVNDRPAKAGTNVNVGDIVTINYGHRIRRYEILQVKENAPATLAREMYKKIE